MNYEKGVNENKMCSGHENLKICEIWMETGMPYGKGAFIRMFPTPTIKYYDISLFDFSK